MSEAIKINNVSTHVVDILGSTKGRDQPIMKMDKAVDLVKCLDREILESDDYVFFDPFCKAGEILLATALVRNLYKSEKGLVDTEKIFKDLYENNRYFALSPDERHYRLTLRTFYGNEQSHNEKLTKNIRNGNYLSEEDGKLDKNKFNKELSNMLEYIKKETKNKKIIAIGNPPYQENDGGGMGSSAKAIYNIFVEALINSNNINSFNLVIPSRWFAGGKGLDSFREKMIKCKNIKSIKYFENSSHVFPSVDIRGGVCFIVWKLNFKGKTNLSNSNESCQIKLDEYDIIIPHIRSYTILKKILKNHTKFLSEVVWPRNPFGIESNYFNKKSKNDSKGSIECFSIGKKVYRISKKEVIKNKEKIEEYKIAYPKASGGGRGQRDKILLKPEHFFILKPRQVSTETYSIAGSFKTLREANYYLNFIRTNFSRFLLGIRKPTQNTSQKNFSWIPMMKMNKKWNDEELFSHFNLSDSEGKYILNQVKKWTA